MRNAPFRRTAAVKRSRPRAKSPQATAEDYAAIDFAAVPEFAPVNTASRMRAIKRFGEIGDDLAETGAVVVGILGKSKAELLPAVMAVPESWLTTQEALAELQTNLRTALELIDTAETRLLGLLTTVSLKEKAAA